MLSKLLLVFALATYACGDQCTMSLDERVDCGYFGIDQAKCEAKNCCWRPTSTGPFGDTPWCFYPQGQNPCATINFDWDGGMGFDDSFYAKMQSLFEANININSKGGVVASPDRNTPGGSYYYHWMRDGALTMRTYMELNNFDVSYISSNMKAYVGWVKKVQAQTDPYGNDIRINPKFELPNGEVYQGGWCRPQTDGPGLRSGSLLLFALTLMKSEIDYVKSELVPLIKFDLDWIIKNWQNQNGCDLWEEVRSSDFFWNRMSYAYSLQQCTVLFKALQDTGTASYCDQARSQIVNAIGSHWTGKFMRESQNREQDSAVIHAFSSFLVYDLTDDKVAKTIDTFSKTFCAQYPLNQDSDKQKIPGILMGRYPGDSYAGGNPWQLLTAVLAKTFYQGAIVLADRKGFLEQEDQQAWAKLLSVPVGSPLSSFVEAQIKAGDSVMYRMHHYVKSGDGHISEQISKTTGEQVSAKDLTWSFANVMSAMKTRNQAVESKRNLLLSFSE